MASKRTAETGASAARRDLRSKIATAFASIDARAHDEAVTDYAIRERAMRFAAEFRAHNEPASEVLKSARIIEAYLRGNSNGERPKA